MSTRVWNGVWLAVVSIVLSVAACASPVSLVINEVAWSGTAASAADEWIELYNPTDSPIDLAGWTLVFGDTVIHLDRVADATVEVRRSVIEPGGYYLLERTDDETVSDITADLIYKGALPNAGIDIFLYDGEGNLVDSIECADQGWPAGTAGDGLPPYASMERVDPLAERPTWAFNDGSIRNGLDAAGGAINGTPAAENSARIIAESSPRIELLAPTPDETMISGVFIIGWTATDPDGPPEGLKIAIYISADGGETWDLLIDGLANSGSYAWGTLDYPNGDAYRLRIVATDPDGNEGAVTSSTFSIGN